MKCPTAVHVLLLSVVVLVLEVVVVVVVVLLLHRVRTWARARRGAGSIRTTSSQLTA